MSFYFFFFFKFKHIDMKEGQGRERSDYNRRKIRSFPIGTDQEVLAKDGLSRGILSIITKMFRYYV